MFKKTINIVLSALIIITLSSCASTEVEEQPAPTPVPAPVIPNPQPEPVPEPENGGEKVPEAPAVIEKVTTLNKHFGNMLWEIKGTGKNGNDANIFFFGTINVADNRIYPVDDNVLSALKHADRVFSELSKEDYEKSRKNHNVYKKDNLVNYENDKNTFSVMSEEECQWLLDNMGLGVLVYSILEPWEVYDSLFTYQMKKTGLSYEKGNKPYFYEKSASLGKTVEALEQLETKNINEIYGDRDSQITSVKDFIDNHIENPGASSNVVKKIYQAYVVGDEVTFTDTVKKAFANRKDIFNKDNKAMAAKIEEILLEGGSTFIFTDITRLIGDNSVFSILEENGVIK